MKKIFSILLLAASAFGASAALNYNRAAIVHNLDVAQTGATYTVSYTLSADAPKVTLKLTNVSNPSDVRTYEQTAVAAGNRTFTVNGDDLPSGAVYTWSISVDHSNLTTPTIAFTTTHSPSMLSGQTAARGGVVSFNDPESPAFGKIVTSAAFGKGFDLYTPELEYEGTYHAGYSDFRSASNYSPYRGAAWGNRAIFVDWSSTGGGLTVFDTTNPSNALTNILDAPGNEKDSNGNYTNGNGIRIGGSGSSVYVTGSGENTKIYQLGQFYDYSNSENEDLLVRYDIGSATTITTPPTEVLSSAKIHNIFSGSKDIEVIPTEYGYFLGHDPAEIAQSSGNPGFVFVDNSGTVRFTSYSLDSTLPTSYRSIGHAMALTADKSVLVCSDEHNHIMIFDVTWNGGVPSVAYRTRLTTSNSNGYHTQMCFDAVGNLCVFSRGVGLQIIGMPRTDSSFEMAADSAKKISSTLTPPAPAMAYAYDLRMEKSGSDFELSFNSTAAAQGGSVVLTRENSDDEPIVIPIPSIVKGNNTVSFPQSTLRRHANYSWAVRIDNAPVSEPGKILSGSRTYSVENSRGGIVVITDPREPSFGKVITSTGRTLGVDVYSPEGTHLGTYNDVRTRKKESSGFSLSRGDQLNGKAVFVDWSDPGAGYWMFDPENPSSASAPQDAILTDIMKATTYQTSGMHVYNGVELGGGATGISILYDGDEAEVYTFNEDYKHPTANTTDNLLRYDIGTSETIDHAPDFVYPSLRSMFYDSSSNNAYNVEVIATTAGVFMSRAATMGTNSATTPGLIFVDHTGAVKLNSHNDIAGASTKTLGPAMAITSDKRTFAITNCSTGIEIYSVHWSAQSVPELSYQYTIPKETNESIEDCQMKFDYAGNLAVFRRGEGYQLYRLKNDETTTIETPAMSTLMQDSFGSGSYTLVDLEDYDNTDDDDNANVTYQRTFESTKWQTLYVPYDMAYQEWKDVAEVAELYNVHIDSENRLILEFETIHDPSATIHPSYPYLIRAYEMGTYTFQGAGKTVKGLSATEGFVDCSSTSEHLTLTGNSVARQGESTADKPLYVLANNRFHRVTTSEVQLEPYRAYLTVERRTRPNGNIGSSDRPLPESVYLMIDQNVVELDDAPNNNETVGARAFAYDLQMTKSGSDFELSFNSTAAAQGGSVVLTRENSDDEPIVIPIPSIVKGNNTVSFPQSTLRRHANYSWAVRIDNAPVSEPGKILSGSRSYSVENTRGGIVVITDPRQPSFGKVITSTGRTLGVDVYSPEGTHLGTYNDVRTRKKESSGFSLSRGDQLNGKAVFVDWSDPGAGYWMFDPENPSSASAPQNAILTDIMKATTYQTSGMHVYNGVALGGGATGISILSDGDEAAIYTFNEDYKHPTANTTDNLLRYDIGTSEAIDHAPDFVYPSLRSMFFDRSSNNTYNVEVIATSEGVFMSRAASMGTNSAATPGLIFVDHTGAVKLNSHNDIAGASAKTLGPAMALTSDKRTFAITNRSEGIEIYSVRWSTQNVPQLSYQYTIPKETSDSIEDCQMKFDYAGNLAVFRRGEGYQLYRLKNDETATVETPALSTLVQDDYSNGSYNLIDLVDYDNPDDDEGAEVTYTRTFESTNWQTLYVPYDMAYDEWKDVVEVAELYNVHLDSEDRLVLEFETIKDPDASIYPNYPYLIRAYETGTFTFHATGKTVKGLPETEGFVDCSSTSEHLTLTGNSVMRKGESTSDKPIYVLGNNRFRRANTSEVDLNPFRAYLTVEKRSRTGARAHGLQAPSSRPLPNTVYLKIDQRDVNLDESTTDVELIPALEVECAPDAEFFNINGVRQGNARSGEILIRVSNGKAEKVVTH